jgi:hypothetical protein
MEVTNSFILSKTDNTTIKTIPEHSKRKRKKKTTQLIFRSYFSMRGK